jgi:hypothetical protein
MFCLKTKENKMNINMIALPAILLINTSAYAANTLNASLIDSAWNSKKVPDGQQCEKFGGNGSTPKIRVHDIPSGTNAIIMEYSDRSYQPMDLGGHGKFAYRIKDNVSEIDVPSVIGHTFRLPESFFLIEAQRAPSWDKAGAYLPPCSGGKGNEYYVTIKAVKEIDGGIREVLGQTEVSLGQY